MPDHDPILIPASALKELEAIRAEDWTFRVDELVALVNAAAQNFLPTTGDGRLRGQLSERTLRHYQTLGCIDPPAKDGRKSTYGYRQYLQALLVRKLLHLGHTAAQIPDILGIRTDEGLLDLLLEGVTVKGKGGAKSRYSKSSKSDIKAEHWVEFKLGESLVLRAKGASPSLSPGQQKQLFRQAIEVLQRHI